jgi:hypothetical protein
VRRAARPRSGRPSKAGPVGLTLRAAGGDAQHDLGVGADVDDEGHPLRLVRLFSQDDPGGVRPDVAGDARQDVDPRAWMGQQAELGGGRPDRAVGGKGERRAAQRRRVDAQQQVVHDRIADDGQPMSARLIPAVGEQASIPRAARLGLPAPGDIIA